MIREVIEQAKRHLASAGIDDARQEAWLLLAHIRRQDRATLLAHALDDLGQDDWRGFQQLVERRAAREPLAQIVGRKEFWSLDFRVTSDVLCPRPDSETLIEAALAEIRRRSKANDWVGHILDLGTGSGCLLLSLLSEMPGASGVGVDVSMQALSIARSNSQALCLADRAAWLCGDWGTALDGRFDVIISNPPRRFEPETALIGGEDGLDAYRSLGHDLSRLLAPNGLVFLEIGAGQAEAVERLLAASGFRTIDRRRDFAGIDRCLIAQLAEITASGDTPGADTSLARNRS